MGEEAIHVTRVLQKCSVSKNKKAEKKKKDKHRCKEKSSKLFLPISAEKLVELIMVRGGLQGGPTTLKACSCAPGCV